ncbi:uncharacterized protein BT62DRAFT_696377 [Guyanagaster necrorhizus]|uniref:Uncharacterized protein n=1 Tax=Guyanagaster necrorhizus TaxID=856835 RepID=A0A9P7VGE0_9AGAR|nr:uncharacterized protein BT62DRAFT_770244 [Guyanagaster necrorhizus MCA 3950]XP_043033146.1 uncharacterized protein BT62DRAFT_696377 [Guyanagaster necrorhizus MCA 3950]KAG7439236.1 hypothetical protein BT62DRAFT_770244 [Guyanagaster necrorhizus MCA 3950]KAG7439646.1 hypothetical protein BT62DRAFT_696377 [Guyanagaster necrorhizus MCA 3950]
MQAQVQTDYTESALHTWYGTCRSKSVVHQILSHRSTRPGYTKLFILYNGRKSARFTGLESLPLSYLGKALHVFPNILLHLIKAGCFLCRHYTYFWSSYS